MVRYVTGERLRNKLRVFTDGRKRCVRTDGRKRCVRRRSERRGVARARLGRLAPAQEEASQVADVVITRAAVVVARAAVVITGAAVVVASAVVVIAGATRRPRRPKENPGACVCRKMRVRSGKRESK